MNSSLSRCKKNYSLYELLFAMKFQTYLVLYHLASPPHEQCARSWYVHRFVSLFLSHPHRNSCVCASWMGTMKCSSCLQRSIYDLIVIICTLKLNTERCQQQMKWFYFVVEWARLSFIVDLEFHWKVRHTSPSECIFGTFDAWRLAISPWQTNPHFNARQFATYAYRVHLSVPIFRFPQI